MKRFNHIHKFWLAVMMIAVFLAAISSVALAQQLYTCGMHPEIISDEPGYCPICSMKLTPKKEGAAAGTIKIDPTTMQNINVRTTTAEYLNLSRTIAAFGELAFPESDVYRLNVKFDGWIEKIFVKYEGQTVKAGDPLVEIYSPGLVAAQQELLIAAKHNGPDSTDTAMLAAAKRRLANWDISQKQIERVIDNGDITRTLTIYAPAGGIVTKRNVVAGDYVKPGMLLFEISGNQTVWVEAAIYENELPFVAMGSPTRIQIPSLGNRQFDGRISYLSPYVTHDGQIDVRIEIPNRSNRLKPKMYADVFIQSQLENKRLTIPRRSVINSGTRSVVYIQADEGVFKPQVVTTGAIGDNDMIEITSGLSAGDIIVTSGQFMLDSESRLSEALAVGATAGHDHGAHDMATTATAEIHETIYTCPMPEHDHVLQYGPGSCAECGMDLVPLEATDYTEVYACPMIECQQVSAEPGRCEVCGMFLKKVERDIQPDKSEDNHSGHGHNQAISGSDDGERRMYMCPHTCGIVKNKPGECPECGVELVEMELSEEEPKLNSSPATTVYTCPMESHFDVVQFGPGQCPKCNMAMIPADQAGNEDFFICPMLECRHVSSDDNSCPVCGMNMVPYTKEGDRDR